MTSLPGRPGHEGFVQPASYLRPRGHSHPMTPAAPETAIDRDQRIGLVRRQLLLFWLLLATSLPFMPIP